MSVILEKLVDFVYPKECVICKKEDTFLCEECLVGLEYAEQICPMCGQESVMGWTHGGCKKRLGLDGLIAVYDYQDERVRKIIEEIKFGFNQELLKQMMRGLVLELGERFDQVTPLPLFKYRENWRGFNQARVMTEMIAKKTGVEMIESLRRVKNTKQQAKEFGKKERFENLEGAFEVVQGESVRGKKVLLVDDVFTTGASLLSATNCLKKAGVKVVWGLVLAH